jgi:type II secretory pathway pseudopilin PulG
MRLRYPATTTAPARSSPSPALRGRVGRGFDRKAFTTLELLVVIGIILLLMAISVLGFRHFDRLASAKQTRAQLNLCKNLLIEYERVSGFKYIEELGPQNQTQFPPIPVYADPNPPPNNYDYKAKLQLTDLVAGGSADVGSHSSSASARYAAQAVVNSRYVTMILARVPANRGTITNIPTNRILEPSPTMPQSATVDLAVVLDGWSNPIIFVPAGGMIVNIKDPTNSSGPPIPFLVRSSGTFPLSQLQQHPITALDRPFFASAGQDSDFTQGEDNVYSFQQD